MSIWEDAKKNLSEWYTFTADRTAEFARITSRRYDKFGLSRDIERQFSELGSVVYNGLREGREDILAGQDVQDLVERIVALEQALRAKDAEIEEIRREAEERKAAEAAAGSADEDAGEQGAAADEADRAEGRTEASAEPKPGPAAAEGAETPRTAAEPSETPSGKPDEEDRENPEKNP